MATIKNKSEIIEEMKGTLEGLNKSGQFTSEQRHHTEHVQKRQLP